MDSLALNLASAQADSVRLALRSGSETMYYWLFCSDFDTWFVIWAAAANISTDEMEPRTFRQKLIDALWRPR